MKEIIAKAFVSSSLLEILGMRNDQTAKDVQEFVAAHPELDKELMEALDDPELQGTVEELARVAARDVLATLKAYVGEAA